MSVTVECQTRSEDSKPRALRREGLIPAALYGHKGTESISLTIKAKDAQNLLKDASINNTLVDVKIPELSWNGKALIREVQSHPWKRNLYHLSFFAVASQATLDVVVPLQIVGTAPGVKEGGVLEQILTELQVQCPPANIPEFIEVDVSGLAMGENLHLRDVVLPEGIVVMDEMKRTIASVVAPASMGAAAEEVDAEASLADTVIETSQPEE